MELPIIQLPIMVLLSTMAVIMELPTTAAALETIIRVTMGIIKITVTSHTKVMAVTAVTAVVVEESEAVSRVAEDAYKICCQTQTSAKPSSERNQSFNTVEGTKASRSNNRVAGLFVTAMLA